MSLTDEGANSTSLPISASVRPLLRSSEIITDQSFMDPSLRDSVNSSQRVPVTEFRDNSGMPLPKGIPLLKTPGERVKWWRIYRGYKNRSEFARELHMPASTISDLESGSTQIGKRLHAIASKLKLNAHYLETGKGEPEIGYEPEPPEGEPWPFHSIKPKDLRIYNKIELSYAESALQQALETIEQERRKAKRSGS